MSSLKEKPKRRVKKMVIELQAIDKNSIIIYEIKVLGVTRK